MTQPSHPDDPTGPATLADGLPVIVREIGPDDQDLLRRFHEGLSDRSVLMRYFHHLALQERIDPDRLRRICQADRDRERVLVVETAGPEFLGIGRWNRQGPGDEAELAVLVADRAQRRGIGSLLVRRLLADARQAGLDRLTAFVKPENREMIELCRKLGRLEGLGPDGVIEATLLG